MTNKLKMKEKNKNMVMLYGEKIYEKQYLALENLIDQYGKSFEDITINGKPERIITNTNIKFNKKYLTFFNLSGTRILTPDKILKIPWQLKKLETLIVDFCEINEIVGLENLTSLKELYCEFNPLNKKTKQIINGLKEKGVTINKICDYTGPMPQIDLPSWRDLR